MMILLSPLLLLSLAAGQPAASSGPRVCRLEEPAVDMPIYTGRLKLGGKSPDGGTIEVNSYYLSFNGRPQIPVTGEFHFTRYPRGQWEEEIVKMKAGGITLLPTYVFWSLHEEQEGVFNWSGDRDLRYFVQLCAKHGMPVLVRIGPFCHGEIRNGGFPDWLFAKALDVRSNDPRYLFYVKRLYGEIARQLKGLYYKDGGPVIAAQIENEHQHSASPWAINYPGEPVDNTVATYDESITMTGVGVQNRKISRSDLGDLHMKTLKDMAVAAGIDTPIYTATGWGMAAVIGNEAIPVTSAYPYPFWAPPAMSDFLMFKDLHRHPDYDPVRYDPEQFPSFCAEMGVGIQMTYSRRPIVTAEAAEALMVRSLGSGSNGIGYYMYHGGSTPKMIGGVGSFNDEPMGMPKGSYDYQAPLGEFGLEHGSYRYLRLIHSFLSDFSDLLAPMQTVLPSDFQAMTPGNRDDVRYAARMKDGRGFIFMINFQDHDTLRHDQTGLQLVLKLRGETLTIPSASAPHHAGSTAGTGPSTGASGATFTLPQDQSVILPFNFEMGGALLKYATAQLLMKIDDGGVEHYFFFAPEGMSTEYFFDSKSVRGKFRFTPQAGLASTFTVRPRKGPAVKVTTLSREQALNSCKVDGRILITRATVLPYGDRTELLSLGDSHFEYVLYPSPVGFRTQSADVAPVTPKFSFEKVGSRRMTVHFDPSENPSDDVEEYFLDVDYTGDVGMAFLQGTLVLDHFYYGSPWMIGLRRFYSRLSSEDFSFYFRPIRPDATYLGDLPAGKVPDFSAGPVCRVNGVHIVPQYRLKL